MDGGRRFRRVSKRPAKRSWTFIKSFGAIVLLSVFVLVALAILDHYEVLNIFPALNTEEAAPTDVCTSSDTECPPEMKGASCVVRMQADGNLVVYDANEKSTWSSGTNGKGTAPFKFVMQPDGNLVVYDSSKALWASGTNGRGVGPYTAKIKDDCNFVVLDSEETQLWSIK